MCIRDSSAGPPETSVLLAGVVTKTAGFYTLFRVAESVLPAFGSPVRFGGPFEASFQLALLVFGVTSLLSGALAALAQKSLRRMLAYSSISQMGYIALGFGAGSALGTAGALFHLFNHAVFKGLLFVNAAAVEKESGSGELEKLGGLAETMPVTGATSVIGMLSTAGVPPLAGVWSKLMIVLALWQAGWKWLAVAGVLGSLITLAYFLLLQRRVFYGQRLERLSAVKEASFWGVAPALLLAAVTVVLGVAFPWLFNTFLVPVDNFL